MSPDTARGSARPAGPLLALLAALPFLGILGGIFFANRMTPYVLGMPFILFWIVLWVVLSSAIMALVYRLDPANRQPADPADSADPASSAVDLAEGAS